MKKILLAVLSISFLTAFYFLFTKKNNFYQYKLNNKTYQLLVADESNEFIKGLMFYKNKKELMGAEGMIFIFPIKEKKTFWNKNTFLDLDVYWINDDRVVGKSFLPSILKSKDVVIVSSEEEVNKVVEIVK